MSAKILGIPVWVIAVWRTSSSFFAKFLHNIKPAFSNCSFSLLVNVLRMVTGYKPDSSTSRLKLFWMGNSIPAGAGRHKYHILPLSRKLGIVNHPTFHRFFCRVLFHLSWTLRYLEQIYNGTFTSLSRPCLLWYLHSIDKTCLLFSASASISCVTQTLSKNWFTFSLFPCCSKMLPTYC